MADIRRMKITYTKKPVECLFQQVEDSTKRFGYAKPISFSERARTH